MRRLLSHRTSIVCDDADDEGDSEIFSCTGIDEKSSIGPVTGAFDSVGKFAPLGVIVRSGIWFSVGVGLDLVGKDEGANVGKS